MFKKKRADEAQDSLLIRTPKKEKIKKKNRLKVLELSAVILREKKSLTRGGGQKLEKYQMESLSPRIGREGSLTIFQGTSLNYACQEK